MSSGLGDDPSLGQLPAEPDKTVSVDARGVAALQVGDYSTQINYIYQSKLTWTDGVAVPPLVDVSGAVDSPYRGLGAFEERDAAFFFGREEATAQVLGRMSAIVDHRGLLVVSGASGAGKSSLLRAGVLPALRGAGLAGASAAASWPCLVLTPGRTPLDELAVRVAPLAGAEAAAVRRGLAEDPGRFALTARQAALAQPLAPGGEPQGTAPGGPEQRLLLVVDQFEQVFTQCADEEERQAFITALSAAAGTDCAQGSSAALVVLVVRADFEARCAGYAQLADAVQVRYLITPMTERQLRTAITGPATRLGSRVDDELAAVLLAEVRSRVPAGAGAGVLPLLSHALDQAWRTRTGNTLTLTDYERTGGIEKAIATSAQRAYDHLPPGQQEVTRQVFTRLTATSADGIDTADRSTRAELTMGKTREQEADVEAVLEAFVAERLLTLAADSVEISHEALLTSWPLLRDTWLAETHTDRIVRTRLRVSAAEWARSGDPSYLYRGTLLQAAAETARRATKDPVRHPPPSQAERDFLDASNRARRRARRGRQAGIAALIILTLASTATAIVASRNATIAAENAANAEQQRTIALSRQLAADSLATDLTDPVTARQLAIAAWSVSPTSQADSAMTTLLADQSQQGLLPVGANTEVFGLAFSPDGTLLATADGDGTVRVWDAVTGHPVGSPLPANTGADAYNVAFSPNGELLATADGDGTAQLWDRSTDEPVGASLRAVTGFEGGVNGVVFSHAGTLLATIDGDGTVRLWNMATGHPEGPPIPADLSGGVYDVAFSPDDRLLATADGDGMVQVWDAATGQPVGAPLPADTGGGVYGVAFNPSGGLLATADEDGTVRLWDPATGQPVGSPLPADTGGAVYGVAFSPSGRLLATADEDGTVRLWDPATGQPVGLPLLADPSGIVYDVVFSPNGRLLATADGDGRVRVWDPTTGTQVGVPIPADSGSEGGVNGVVFSHAGKPLAIIDDDGTVRLRDPATEQPVGASIPADTGGTVNGAAFSPDGKLLATADGDGTVRLWNPATGTQVGFSIPADPSGIVYGVAFSPDGKLLASADEDGTVRLWDPATGKQVGVSIPADPSGIVYGVAFSPSGRLLATADEDGTVRLWDPATGQPVGASIPADPGGAVYGAAFSPSGRLLATADEDGTVRLWDPATSKQVGAALPADTGGAVYGVAFSPNGTFLAAAASDDDGGGMVRVWEVPLVTNPYGALCAEVGPPTPGEWNQYAPGEPFPKVCS